MLHETSRVHCYLQIHLYSQLHPIFLITQSKCAAVWEKVAGRTLYLHFVLSDCFTYNGLNVQKIGVHWLLIVSLQIGPCFDQCI